MTPPDPKKLVAIFLLLASTVGFLAAIAPAFISPLKLPAPGPGKTAFQSVARNAFVETISVGNASDDVAPSADAAETDNLTENLARTIAGDLVAKNPDGPVVDDGGEPTIVAPDIEALVEQFAGDPAVMAKIIANQGSAVSQKSIRTVLGVTTGEENVSYLTAMKDIINRGTEGVRIANADESDGVSPEMIQAAGVVAAEATMALEKMAVPRKFVGLHLAALRTFASWEKMTSVGIGTDDPLKEAVALEIGLQEFARVSSELQAEARILISKAQKVSGARPGLPTASGNSLFGIQKAHAQALYPDKAESDLAISLGFGIIDGTTAPIPAVPSKDVTTNPKTTKEKFLSAVLSWATKILDYLKEALKQRLITMMVNNIVTWIQGGGKPQFLTDWKKFLGDAANQAIGDTLNEISPDLCGPFRPFVRIVFSPSGQRIVGRPARCTLDTVVQNVQAFAGDFSQGGWTAYAAVLQPSNNIFGTMIQTSDYVNRKAAEAAEAARNETLAGGGTASKKRCVNYTTVRPPGCEGSWAGPPDPACAPRRVCTQWEITIPGTQISAVLNKALTSPMDRLIGAKTWKEIGGVLTDAVVSRLMEEAENGLLGLKAPKEAKCRNLTGPAYDRCVLEKNCRDAGLTGKRLDDCLGKPPNDPMPTVIPPPPTPTSTINLCAEENCTRGCLCKGQDGINSGDFCFLQDISAAQARVLAAFEGGAADTGLVNPPYGTGSAVCTASVCVQDHEAYKNAVVAEIKKSANPNITDVKLGEEVCVIGTCDKEPLFSNQAASLCPGASKNPPDYSIPTGPRKECTKIESSFHTIMRTPPNGICPM